MQSFAFCQYRRCHRRARILCWIFNFSIRLIHFSISEHVIWNQFVLQLLLQLPMHTYNLMEYIQQQHQRWSIILPFWMSARRENARLRLINMNMMRVNPHFGSHNSSLDLNTRTHTHSHSIYKSLPVVLGERAWAPFVISLWNNNT